MDQVEVFRTQEPDKASRAERLLRNADVQSWAGSDGEWTLVLVKSQDVTTAQELLGAYDAVSKLPHQSGPAEADRPFWRQPGALPMALAAAILLFALLGSPLAVMLAIVGIPLLVVRIVATVRRGSDRFDGPDFAHDQPRHRHRYWRMLKDPAGSSDPRNPRSGR